jgi:hypothetical protein
VALPNYRRPGQDRSNSGSSTIDAFPSWLWASLLLVSVGALLLALARARRLGPPVAEPLPVVVPAAEAVTGRGRLYHRINARGPTLDALRVAAISRMAKALNPYGRASSDGAADADELVRQIARNAGQSEAVIREILYDAAPDNDPALAQAVRRLDALVAVVLSPPDRPPAGSPPPGGAPAGSAASPALSTSDGAHPPDSSQGANS